ncbi:hypothetical protein RUM44_012236 [Polyplax serrata]|uniref:Uncharacterized protein n=1 Tax=Polyplax serrata TaxID=468196 RepID=A0ABR1BCV3_POLSC
MRRKTSSGAPATKKPFTHPQRVKTKKEPLKETTEKKNSKGGPLGRILESSGGSSGIGSDHPPSPDQNGRYLDNHSTSGARQQRKTFSVLPLVKPSRKLFPD